jgi:hypothetical protein
MSFRVRLTIGSSDCGGIIFGGPRRESMVRIKELRLSLARPRIAQPNR